MTSESRLVSRAKYTKGLVLLVTASGIIALLRLVWPAAIPVLGVVTIALIGLVGSNLLYDRGVPNSLSRRFAPVMGGLAYLAAVQLLDRTVAIAVSATMAFLIITLRMGFRTGLRGVRGSHPAQAWAEITYPVAGTLSLVVGWGIFGEKWLGFLPVAFMAWGDTASGLARETISDNTPTAWTVVAMLAVCLVAAAIFFQPLLIGVIGSAVATMAERFRPGVLGFWDDNLYIVIASLTVMSILTRVL